MAVDRLIKVNELIRIEVSHLLKSELELDPGILVTITSVTTSRTLEHATIKISVFPQNQTKRALEEIDRRIYGMQQTLNKRLRMRLVPKISFKIDPTEEEAGKIEELLDKMNTPRGKPRGIKRV